MYGWGCITAAGTIEEILGRYRYLANDNEGLAESGLPKPVIPYIAPPSLGPRGGVVTRRSAKPFTRVRVPTWPPSQPPDISAIFDRVAPAMGPRERCMLAAHTGFARARWKPVIQPAGIVFASAK